MNMDNRLKKAIIKINNMSDEEFIEDLIKFRYKPCPDITDDEENSDNYIDKQN